MLCIRLFVCFLSVAAAVCWQDRELASLSGIERHCPNPPQKRYELLRDFTRFMAQHADLRWSLGFGSLLGAMRQDPPGFIQLDDDLDLYMPARDLLHLQDLMLQPGGNSTHDTSFGVMKPELLSACCSFGWRVYHRNDKCAYMDFFALALEQKKGFSQKAWLIPGGWFAPACPQNHLGQWKEAFSGEASWIGPRECLWKGAFEGFYMLEDEFAPLQQMQMYDLSVNIPKQAWHILLRRYGQGARDHDDHGHDFRKDPQWRKPAIVTIEKPARLMRREKKTLRMLGTE